MNNKFWLLIAGVLGVAILAMGWFLGVSPKLDEMSAANDQRASVEAQNKLHEAKLAQLKEQFTHLDELKTDLAAMQLGLPPGDELSTFLGQLHQLESASGATLTKFAASEGQRYIPADGSTTNPLVTAENFVAITIDLTVTGTRAQVIDFLSDLQYGDRMFLVSKLSVAQDQAGTGSDSEPGTKKYTGSITGYVYVLVDPSAPPPTPTPVGSLDTQPSPSPAP